MYLSTSRILYSSSTVIVPSGTVQIAVSRMATDPCLINWDMHITDTIPCPEDPMCINWDMHITDATLSGGSYEIPVY